MRTCDSHALAGGDIALARVSVTDSSGRTVAAFTAQQRVIAERLTLTHVARGTHRLRGTDALAGDLVTQPPAALARCTDTETEINRR